MLNDDAAAAASRAESQFRSPARIRVLRAGALRRAAVCWTSSRYRFEVKPHRPFPIRQCRVRVWACWRCCCSQSWAVSRIELARRTFPFDPGILTASVPSSGQSPESNGWQCDDADAPRAASEPELAASRRAGCGFFGLRIGGVRRRSAAYCIQHRRHRLARTERASSSLRRDPARSRPAGPQGSATLSARLYKCALNRALARSPRPAR